jgi:hypothetical protein
MSVVAIAADNPVTVPLAAMLPNMVVAAAAVDAPTAPII